MPFPVGYSGIYNSSVSQHFKLGPLQQAIHVVLSFALQHDGFVPCEWLAAKGLLC